MAFLTLLGIPLPGRAASPRDELLRLVPEDVAFCLVVQDLRGHVQVLQKSEFFQALVKIPLVKALKASPEMKKLAEMDRFLQAQLGLDGLGIIDQFLGDAVVLAYRPNPPGKTDQDQGLILLRARNAKVLSDFLDRLNKVQMASGDLTEVTPRQWQGVTYYRRAERKGENFYYLNGPRLVFSSQEKMLHQAMERERQGSVPGLTKPFQLLGTEQALASLWINPRAFDEEMEHKAAQATGEEALGPRTFLRYWKALDSIGLALFLGTDLRIQLALRARTHALPPTARRFLGEAALPSALWDRFPEDALLAVAGRWQASALLEMIGEFLTSGTRQTLFDSLETALGAPAGKDFRKEILPALGPDWGLCLASPTGVDRSWFPSTLLALRIGSDPTGEGETVPQAIFSVLTFYAQLAVLSHNRDKKDLLSLKTMSLGGTQVKYLTGGKTFPPGVQPAFALQQGYLVLASSPEVLRRFGTAPSRSTTRKDGEVPLLRLSAQGLCRLLTDQRALWVETMVKGKELPREEANQHLNTLVSILKLFDRLEITQRCEAGRVTLTLRLQTLPPLK
jgi:hypothetical protein